MRSFQLSKQNTRLGTVLLGQGLLTREQLQLAVSCQGEQRLGDYLVSQSLITSSQLKRALRRQSWLRLLALIIAFVLSPFNLGYAQDNMRKSEALAAHSVVQGEQQLAQAAPISRIENYNNEASFERTWELYDALLLDHSWQGIVQKNNATLIDYRELKGDDRMIELIRRLEKLSPQILGSSHEKLAFFINAYNILAIYQVASLWPVKLLQNDNGHAQGVWAQTAGIIGGQALTLRRIEADILGSMQEPRVYFGLCNGSVSAPSLRQEAYRPDLIFEQLNDQAEQFVYDHKGVHQKGKHTYLSKLFSWHEPEFEMVGGVQSFITKFRPGLHDKYNFEGYLQYDWSVAAHLNRQEQRQLRA